MLSVLIKNRLTGRETLYPATCVEFSPVKKQETNSAGILILNLVNEGLLVVNGEDSQHIGVSMHDDDLRDVFVMNENGSTVARYVL